MSNENGGGGLLAAVQNAAAPGLAELTVVSLRQHRPDLVNAIESAHDIAAKLAEAKAAGLTEGKTAGMSEGVNGERTRIAAIQEAMLPGQEALCGTMIKEGKTVAEAQSSFIADYKAKGVHMAAITGGERQVSGLTAAPNGGGGQGGGGKPVAKSPDEWKAEFAASPVLQQEFASAENYVAFKKNESKVRVLNGRQAA